MQKFLFLSIGAIAGAGARYGIGVWTSNWLAGSTDFPWATFGINVSGSLLLGFFMRYLTGVPASPELRIMLTTGFCGAFTTMSTFSYEFVSLMGQRQHLIAGAYMLSTMIASPLACFGGYAVAGLLL